MTQRASYQPQFAFPPCPSGYKDVDFVHYFDAVSTPALGSTIAAGGETLDVPLFLEQDADFIARAIRVFGAARFQFREPSGKWLSEGTPAFPPVLRQSYQGQGLDLTSSGTFFQPPVVLEPEIFCRAGSAFTVYIYNPAAAPAAVAGFIAIEGVKRIKQAEAVYTTLAGAVKDARQIAANGTASRVMDKDTGRVYREYKAKRANPPSGFIPCKAVKITRNRGVVEVRVRR